MSLKSDKANPRAHTVMPAGKKNHPAAMASSGTSEHPRKSHEADVALGEGLEYGAVQMGHKKMAVKEAKHVMGMTEASRGRAARRENGHANPEGEL